MASANTKTLSTTVPRSLAERFDEVVADYGTTIGSRLKRLVALDVADYIVQEHGEVTLTVGADTRELSRDELADWIAAGNFDVHPKG